MATSWDVLRSRDPSGKVRWARPDDRRVVADGDDQCSAQTQCCPFGKQNECLLSMTSGRSVC